MEEEEGRGLRDGAFEHAPIGIVVQNLDGEVVLANRIARDDLTSTGMLTKAADGRVRIEAGDDPGVSIVDRTGRTVGPDDIPAWRALRTGQPVRRVVQGLRNGANTIWAAVDAVPLEQDGMVVGVVTYASDVTSAVHNEELHAELLDKMTDGYVVVDNDHRFSFVNTAAATILRAEVGQLIGRSVFEHVPSLEHSEMGDMYRQVCSGGSIVYEGYVEEIDRWVEVRAHGILGGVVAYLTDVSDRHDAEAERLELQRQAEDARRRLVHTATTDSLTGLLNRSSIETWVQHHLDTTPSDPLAMLLVDLDHFKQINDTMGHDAGDEVLVQVADRIGLTMRETDVVARLGGDEFLIVLRGATATMSGVLAERLLYVLRSPFGARGRQYSLSASIGIATSGRCSTARCMLSDADTAMYEAKGTGRNRYVVFDDDLRRRAEERFETDADLRTALGGQEVVAHYQPLFSTATGLPTAVEALARWEHPTRGLLAAGDFVPVAEESELIVGLGTRMLESALADLGRISEATGDPGTRAWVNVSARQLDQPGHMEMLQYLLSTPEVMGRVGVEVTETALVRDASGATAALRRLAGSGVPIALDDFGTGFSSLTRLLDFPIFMLKIDQAFTHALQDGRTVAAVRAIVELASAVDANVCLEGVEDDHQLRVAIDLGVERVSGYHLARPVALDDLRREIARSAPRLKAFTGSAPDCLTGAAGV